MTSKPLKTIEELLDEIFDRHTLGLTRTTELTDEDEITEITSFDEVVVNAHKIKTEAITQLNNHYYQLMLSLVDSLEYNSKLSRSYFQPTINSKKNHKNGYRLAVREMKAKLSEHFNGEGEI